MVVEGGGAEAGRLARVVDTDAEPLRLDAEGVVHRQGAERGGEVHHSRHGTEGAVDVAGLHKHHAVRAVERRPRHDGIVGAGIAEHQRHPLPDCRGADVVGELGLQLGVAALPGIAVVVANGAGEVGVVGAARLGAVAEHQLHGACRTGVGDGGEPVAVVASEVVLRCQRIGIGIADMLVPDTGTELRTAQQESIGGKAGVIVLLHLGHRGGDDDAADGVFVGAPRDGLLGTGLQLTLPDGIGEDGLGGVEAAGIVAAAGNAGVVRHRADFLGQRTGGVVRTVVVEIDIDAELADDDTVVVEVGAEVVGGAVANAVVGGGGEFVGERAVLIDHVVHHGVEVERQLTSPLHLAAEEVIVCQLPVDTGIAVKASFEALAHQRTHFVELKAPAVRSLVDVALLTEGEALIVHAAEDVHAARAVVDVEGSEGVVVPSPAGRL